MPIKNSWFNEEKTIFYIRYDGKWTLDEYYQNFQEAAQLIKEAEHSVISIIDFTTSGPFPPGFMTVGNHSQRNKAPNNIQIIIVGFSQYLQVFMNIFNRVFPKLMRGVVAVRTLEEALQTAEKTLNQELSEK